MMYEDLIKRLHRQAAYLPEKFSKNAELLDVLMKAADAIEELSGRDTNVPRWIPVEERLPEDDGFTLIFTEHGNPGVCYFTCGWWGGYDKDGITNWMPLPEPPKEG
jgi:hypothetical protein